MKRSLPPLNWLRTFEASARYLSFTSAAAELNLTQAAVSKQIKLLEQYLREPLFHRKARSLSLTRVGAAYLPKVKESIELLAEGTEEVFGFRQSELLTVRVTIGFAANWLAPRMIRYYQRHPTRPVRLVSSVWNDEFSKEQFDLDIRYGTGDWLGFRTDRLTWEDLTPLCSPALIDGSPPLHAPADLRNHQLLHVLGYEEGWATWLKAAGIDDINFGQGYQFDSSLVAHQVAATGIGVALGRRSLIETSLAHGRLVAPFKLAIPIDEAFYLMSPAGGTLHPDADVFRKWLLEEAEEQKKPA